MISSGTLIFWIFQNLSLLIVKNNTPGKMSNYLNPNRWARLTNMRVRVRKPDNKAVLSVPSFGIIDINRAGNICIAGVHKHLGNAQMVGFHEARMELSDDVVQFLGSSRIEASRLLYGLPDAPQMPPLLANYHLRDIGNASLNFEVTLVDEKRGDELARSVSQMIILGAKSLRPSLIPAWWKEKYRSDVIPRHRLSPTKPIEVPGHAYVYRVNVPWSAAGPMSYTSYASYPDFCFDAAMTAMQAGFYSKFPDGEDILNFHVKKMEANYIGMSRAGDILEISTWENKENPYVLYFNLSITDKPVNQITMEFYEP